VKKLSIEWNWVFVIALAGTGEPFSSTFACYPKPKESKTKKIPSKTLILLKSLPRLEKKRIYINTH